MAKQVDILVAGGGIAGLTAGLTAARLGFSTLVLVGDVLGGQLLSIEKIDGYPGFPEGVPGYDLAPMAQEQAEASGAEFVMARLDTLARKGANWLASTAEGEFVARGVVIATGSRLATLGVPGEARLTGKGVSHCASCDAPLLRGKTAIVVGGGDSALQESLTLAAHAAKVVLVNRGAALSGQKPYREAVESNGKIDIRHGATVEEILGDDGVTGARVRDETGVADIEASGVFAFVGLRPNTECLARLVALDADGRAPTDASMRTMAPGLCVAGNLRVGSPCRAASSAGDGATAVAALARYLADGVWGD